MKKLLSIALCLIMVVAVACMAGCGNDELLKKMDDLQAALQTQNGKIDELQTQNSQFTEKLDELQDQNSQLTEKLDELQNQNTQLSGKLDEMQTVIDGQTDLIDFLKEKTVKGQFYTVKQAYEKGYITLEDVKSIAYYQNHGREYNENIMPEDYIPIPKIPKILNKQTDLVIKQLYVDIENKNRPNNNLTIDDLWVGYGGTYNNCSAVKIWIDDVEYDKTIDIENVDGVKIVYPELNRLLIFVPDYIDFEMSKTQVVEYSVWQAYKKGILNLEDVKSIAYYHNGGRKFNEEVMPEDYSPIPKNPEQLSIDMQRKIKREYIIKYLNTVESPTVDDVRIDKYYGTYNGYAAVRIFDNYCGFLETEEFDTINGIKIYYGLCNYIKIWRIEI